MQNNYNKNNKLLELSLKLIKKQNMLVKNIISIDKETNQLVVFIIYILIMVKKNKWVKITIRFDQNNLINSFCNLYINNS